MDAPVVEFARVAIKKFYKILKVIGSHLHNNNMFKNLKKLIDMARITVNDSIFTGSSIVINKKIIIDGVDVTPEGKIINIKVEGDIDKLDVAACESIVITGNVRNIETVSGDIEVSGDVAGSIETTSGDVTCANIGGDVETLSGDVRAAEIHGGVETLSGDIKR